MMELNAAVFNDRFESTIEGFRGLLKANEKSLNTIGQQFEKELDAFRQRGFLTIAFVGEYSSGKSSIISALTNRRDIAISADIATDRTTAYQWKDIRLIDTPGLYTERSDHDEITYDAIRQADLLVFCLTHALFDSITVQNFKKLAFDERYITKMLLVVNKMSSEAGNDDVKISSYTKGLETALAGHSIGSIKLCFIDARDFLDGSDANDVELLQSSRFDTFIDALNSFVTEKGVLARLDTPVRIAIGHLREASSVLSRTTQEDNAFLEILNRLSKAVERERGRLRSQARGLASELSAQVADIGIKLSQFVGTPDELVTEAKKAEAEICARSETACVEFEAAVQQTQDSLKTSVSDVLDSDLTTQFIARLDSGKVASKGVEINVGASRLLSQVKTLGEIGGKVGANVSKLAQGGKATQGILTASAASGSYLHKGILGAGKLIGYSFKPWQAVNLAKTIGNVAQALGPILAVIGIAMEIANSLQEAENERLLSDGRKNVVADFLRVATELEAQFETQLREVEKELHDRLEGDINAARVKEETEISRSNQEVACALEIRGELDEFLLELARQH